MVNSWNPVTVGMPTEDPDGNVNTSPISYPYPEFVKVKSITLESFPTIISATAPVPIPDPEDVEEYTNGILL